MGARLKSRLCLFCEKNSDGTKNLVLKGTDMFRRLGARLGPSDMETVGNFINETPQIVHLNLCYNNIGNEGLKILCNIALEKPNQIQHLNIMHCDVTHAGMEFLHYAALQNHLHLKTLRLCGNDLQATGGQVAALIVRYCPSLEYLDLGNTHQTYSGIDSILGEISHSCLKVLNIGRMLSNHYLGNILAKLLRKNYNLLELHLQKCCLDGHDIEILLLGMYENNCLRYLDLGYNHLCDHGTQLIADWLTTRPKITALNLAGNKIRESGATALSFSLPYSHVRFLDISDNHITSLSLVAILNTIKKPYILRYLFIWGNTLDHNVNKRIESLIRAGVLEKEGLDVRIHSQDGVLYASHYPTNTYQHRYFEVMDYGCMTELKIKRNRLEHVDGEEPRALIRFEHMDRYPALRPKKKNQNQNNIVPINE